MKDEDAVPLAAHRERKSCTAETFGLEPNTTNDADSHGLPPDPVDEVKSTIRSSHGPIVLAIDIRTTGACTTEGADIVTFWGLFELQLEQVGSTFEVHRALTTPLFSNHKLPTRIEEVERPNEEISREVALVHKQRNDKGEGSARGGEEREEKTENNSPQFDTPPRFVGELNVTVTLLPSEVNSDLCTSGAGKVSSFPFTTNTSPTGNTTL
jgi:hypothetical protein